MILYLDTSSFLKLFIVEEHSEAVREHVASADGLHTSIVSWPEAKGVIARAVRGNRILAESYAASESKLLEFWNKVDVVDVTTDLIAEAGDLAARFYLRGLDAIHLASAVTLQRYLNEPVAFSAFDDRLLDAAEACGLVRG